MTRPADTVLFVRNAVSTPYCVSARDGARLGVAIREHLRLGYDTHVSFAETLTLSSAFVAAMLDGMSPDAFRVSGLSPDNLALYEGVAADPAPWRIEPRTATTF